MRAQRPARLRQLPTEGDGLQAVGQQHPHLGQRLGLKNLADSTDAIMGLSGAGGEDEGGRH